MELPEKMASFLLLMLLPMLSDGFPNGRVENSCTSMVPSHGVDAQVSPPPYSLSISSLNYTGILGFNVTLCKEVGALDFRGFMIQARAPNGDTPLGIFLVSGPDAQTLTCTTTNDTVSHMSNTMKSNVSVIWLPTQRVHSNIQFRATVVQVRTVFWTNILSDVIHLASAGPHLLAPSLIQLLLCSAPLIYTVFTI